MDRECHIKPDLLLVYKKDKKVSNESKMRNYFSLTHFLKFTFKEDTMILHT